MRRIKRTGRSKRGLTLVELVVAMALTMIFMASCVMLVYPVEKIYTHTNDLSRAQLIADAVVDSLRAECTNANVSQPGDVYVKSGKGDGPLNSTGDSAYGDVLFIRRNNTYFESISANYAISQDHYDAVNNVDAYDSDDYRTSGDIRSREIYRLYSSGFTVKLDFDDSVNDLATCPEYIECDVTVLHNGEAVYTRHVVLCF